MKEKTFLAYGIVFIALLFFGCVQSESTPITSPAATPAKTPTPPTVTATQTPVTSASPSLQASEQTIIIKDFAFSPSELRIAAGTKIVWRNEDNVGHTVTSTNAPEPFDSGSLSNGGEWSKEFVVKGTYEYLCTPHSFMKGKIIVE